MVNFSVDDRLVIQIIQFLKYTSVKSEGQRNKRISYLLQFKTYAILYFQNWKGIDNLEDPPPPHRGPKAALQMGLSQKVTKESKKYL